MTDTPTHTPAPISPIGAGAWRLFPGQSDCKEAANQVPLMIKPHPQKYFPHGAAMRLSFSLATALALFPTLTLADPVAPGAVTDAVEPAAVVQTKAGPLQGVNDGQMLAWLGVPYAAAPLGDGRWMPPQKPAPWTDIRSADQLGASCAQGPDLGFFATPGGSEDCLFLNVYGDQKAINRARATGKGLPVFFWIHGGALHVGQGADYNPRAMIADGKAIVITLNYRLGLFGFFAHPAIDDEGHPRVNYGQMDQTFALQWVHDNIAAFGGDPANVTIAGESSGGNSVISQVLSPWAAGLFQNAIEMSGSAMMLKQPHFGAVTTLDTAQALGQSFSQAVGCDTASDAARCLRDLSTADILTHQTGYQISQTVIEGDFLTDWPETLLQNGTFNHVNIVSGTMRDEGDFFAALPEVETGQVMSDADYPAALVAMYGQDLAPKVAEAYPVDAYPNASKAYAATVTAYLFTCPAQKFRRLAAGHTNVWAYEFADRTAPSYAPPTSFDLQAAHTFELSYLFPGFHGGNRGTVTTLNPQQQVLAETFQGYFTSVSDAENWADWPASTADQPQTLQMQLGVSRILDGQALSEEHKCAFWDAQNVY